MKLLTKKFWMDIAEIADALRIFPRWLAGSYWAFTGWAVEYVTVWYAHLPAVDRTVAVTGFYGMLMGGLFGLAAYVFKAYTDGGVDWTAYRKSIYEHSLKPSSPI